MRHQADPRISASVLEALIKAGLILLLVLFCYQVLAPFMALMLWALVLAITLYPTHQKLTARVGNKPGLAATLIVLFGVLLLVVPSGFLLSSVADTVSPLIGKMQSHSLQIPPPQEQVASWPLIGPKLYGLWQQAASDLPALLGSVGPELAAFAKKLMGFAASMGGGMFMFLFAFLVSGSRMAYGKAGAASMKQIAERHSAIGDIRGPGAMIAIELFTGGDLARPDADRTRRIVAEALRRGLILLSCGVYANVIRILVPLTASDAVLDEGLAVLSDCFDATA